MRMKNYFKHESNAKTVVAGCLAVIIIGLFICFIMPLPLMWGWNYGIVNIITVAQPITYWTAFWIIAFLSSCGTALGISTRVSSNRD